MFELLKNLDRRWIFVMMFLAVAVPILLKTQFPEKETELVQQAFDTIDELPPGSDVLLAFDYDPASEGELGPMATAFVRHCCEKKHKMYFLALWPVGPQMIDDTIRRVIRKDFPHLVYGEDYVNLGFKPGQEGVIKVIVTDLRQLYTTDDKGTGIDSIPMCRRISTVRDFDLLLNVSAGYPGTKEWVQYAATPYPKDITIVAGCTGVQASLLYPYIPEQLPGLLGAIKGAAEYEKLVLDKYGKRSKDDPDKISDEESSYQQGGRRMGPQLIAHLLMIGLIVAGNIIFFIDRRRERQA